MTDDAAWAAMRPFRESQAKWARLERDSKSLVIKFAVMGYAFILAMIFLLGSVWAVCLASLGAWLCIAMTCFSGSEMKNCLRWREWCAAILAIGPWVEDWPPMPPEAHHDAL